MERKVIKYVGFYDVENYSFEKRVKGIAAVNKMNYIASAIERAGFCVEIISPSWTANINGYYKKRKTPIKENISLVIGPSFGANNFITKKFRILLSLFWLFTYLIQNTKKDEKIIVYHSIMATFPIYIAQKIKQFKIILEFTEIYQDVTDFSINLKRLEKRIVKKADSYILSTELLKSKINTNKSFMVNYGNYQITEKTYNPFDNKIHIVYAGILDKLKGAFNAVESAKYLSGKYVIRIIGFGNSQDIADLQDRIEQENSNNVCKIFFDGLKYGEEYTEYISKCNIGLSTQSPEAEYNNTSFPSKVLSYLSMGLRVVTIDIEAIRISQIGHILYYYNENNGKSIADAILNIEMNSQYDSKKVLIELDRSFIEDMQNLLNSVAKV